MLGNSRDIGLNHGPGKGDKNRSDSKAFRDRYEDIDFSRSWKVQGTDDGFRQRGQRLVKRYGPAARPTIEVISFPPAHAYLPDDMRPATMLVKLVPPSGILK